MWRLSCLVVGNAVVSEEEGRIGVTLGFCRVETVLVRRLGGRAVVWERAVGAWCCLVGEVLDVFHIGKTCHSGLCVLLNGCCATS